MAPLQRTISFQGTDESLTESSSPENSHSDKENRNAALMKRGGTDRRDKRHPMAPAHDNNASKLDVTIPNKRPRLSHRSANEHDGGQAEKHPLGYKYYDPHQSEAQRRELRKGLRDLSRELHDSRSEYMQAGNDGIRKTIEKANSYFERVKQTSDATIDSRLLVSAADLSYKKAMNLAQGDGSAGLDVDEFVSKCIAYMREGPRGSQTRAVGSQRRRQHALGRSPVDPDDSDGDQGDSLNWEWLGRAAVRYNTRPAVSGFLLGPLAVQKRTRQQIQRRARERIDPSQLVQPQDLRNEDLGKKETSNLTAMCTSINKLLERTQTQAQSLADQELSRVPAEKLTNEIRREVMDKYNLADDGGVSVFRFCFNPQSFGQTVENLFYVSFLIRDSTVKLAADSQGNPTLHSVEPMSLNDAKSSGVQRRQTIFSLDFDNWQDLIKGFGITEPIIPHREEEQSSTDQRWQ